MPFRYLRDPLFLVCVAAYFINRWAIKPHVTGGFFHHHFNDLICIPFWVTPLVWLARRMKFRTHDRRPAGIELLLPLIIWSFAFEVWLPQTATFRDHSTADPFDILWYVCGALLATLFWDWWYRARPATMTTATAART